MTATGAGRRQQQESGKQVSETMTRAWCDASGCVTVEELPGWKKKPAPPAPELRRAPAVDVVDAIEVEPLKVGPN